MIEINDIKIRIFDIIIQQEALAAQNNQLEQAKRSLLTRLAELKNTPQEANDGEDIHTDN